MLHGLLSKHDQHLLPYLTRDDTRNAILSMWVEDGVSAFRNRGFGAVGNSILDLKLHSAELKFAAIFFYEVVAVFCFI